VIIEQQQKLQLRQEKNDRATGRFPVPVKKLIAELESPTMTARRRRDYSTALSAIKTRLACLETIGRLTRELHDRAGEHIPAMTAPAAASEQVNLAN
jgi:hypothetical protein